MGWGKFIVIHFATTQAMQSVLALLGGLGNFLTWLLIVWQGFDLLPPNQIKARWQATHTNWTKLQLRTRQLANADVAVDQQDRRWNADKPSATFKIQDSRMVYCNFNRNLHGIHSKTEAQVGLFVLNTITLNCITLTSLVQQVSKVQDGVVPVIHVLYTVRVNNDNM